MDREFVRGIQAAVKHLRGTAADYDQMAAQQDKSAQSEKAMLPGHRLMAVRSAQGFRNQAILLRGQATIIEDMAGR